MDECYADGGEVMGDDETMMDQVALECMHAIDKKDKQAFMDSLHVLIADILNKMGSDEGDK